MEPDKVGYDLLCKKGAKERHVEVKGASGPGSDFFMTAGELACAKIEPASRVCVVTCALTSPSLMTINRKELLADYDFRPLSYRVSPKRAAPVAKPKPR